MGGVNMLERVVDTQASLRELLAQIRADGYTHVVVAHGKETSRSLLWDHVPLITTPELGEGEGIIVPLVAHG